jgi:hypothetical protein
MQFPLDVPGVFRSTQITWSAADEPPALMAERIDPAPVEVDQ